MKTFTKLLGIVPVISLASCGVYHNLTKEQAIQRASDILSTQNAGQATFKAFTYNGQFSMMNEDNNVVAEGIKYKLVRSYETPYLYFNAVTEENGALTNQTNLWIYQTNGNVVIVYSDDEANEAMYTAYPLTLEDTFDNLVEATSTLTNLEHVEELIYSQDVLEGIETLFNSQEPRVIYQGYQFNVESAGSGNLSLFTDFVYTEGDTSLSVHEEYNFNDNLFSSLLHVGQTTFLQTNGNYNTTTVRQYETIKYSAKLTYPDLNEYTFVQNN